MQHLEKSTNLLCIDAWQALRNKIRPNPARLGQPELPNANVEDSEGNSDLEERDGLVDLDTMPVEVEVEGLVVEAGRVADEDHDAEEDANRTGMALGGISIESHNRLESPPVYVKKFGGQAGKPVHTYLNGGYSKYNEQLETGGRENIWAPFNSRLEWEVAQWAKLRGPGSTSFTEFLEIEGVGQIHWELSNYIKSNFLISLTDSRKFGIVVQKLSRAQQNYRQQTSIKEADIYETRSQGCRRKVRPFYARRYPMHQSTLLRPRTCSIPCYDS